MELILTHDNADFDAVASLLAAHKLNPTMVPVLPVNLRRNVEHFVNLYWDSFPFTRQNDLTRQKLSRILLVDTQHLLTVKGYYKETAVEIIDHHDRRPSLKAHWSAVIDPVGATATVLTEQIMGQGIPLTPIEATLIALGIYEDTGSLSYGTTTSRDIYSAGWLVEQGALLDVIREFLHFPLVDEQKEVYHQLIQNTETVEIDGHVIILATASAPELQSEVAVLAHKLRDFFDPTAIFLLIELKRHIQLVARSTSDAIDVGEVARHFGGGGHNRAAAARIKGRTMKTAREKVLEALYTLIKPGQTVGDVMSFGVQTLPVSARADKAGQLMTRYGHEGFPVVEGEHVVGLLTRRAVDRALYHGLEGITVNQIMEPGEVTVKATDSLSTLRVRMVKSGWGQIPVVDDSGRITGVVTRTDLIRETQDQAVQDTSPIDIVERLDSTLSPLMMALVREIGTIAETNGLTLFVVGGFVRDLLLERPTADIDFVVEGDGITLTRELVNRFGGEMRKHQRFGTGKWLLDEAVWREIAHQLEVEFSVDDSYPQHIDFVTARTEFYEEPTVLPTVRPGGIKLDLHRRDFTINTLAIRLDPRGFGRLIDYYAGLGDLRSGVIRVLHSLSFVDDPTRMLRAVRFEQRFDFQIEARTEEMIQHWLPYLDRVSGDRIRHEINFLLEESEPERGLSRMVELGILRTVHPALSCDEWVQSRFKAVRDAVGQGLWPEISGDFDPSIPYFALLTFHSSPDVVTAASDRLKVRGLTRKVLEQVSHLKATLSELEGEVNPSQIDLIFRDSTDYTLITLWASTDSEKVRQAIIQYAKEYRHVQTGITGEDLKEMGIRPGPKYKQILSELRRARLDGEISTDDDERKRLSDLLSEIDSSV